MDDSVTGGAMTEIALALAMAFFCILVLALVSMGQPPLVGAGPMIDTARPGATAQELADEDRLVIFHAGRFAGPDGAPADPRAPDDRPVVLAIDPALPLERVLAARAAFAGATVRVTVLDAAWVAHLSARKPNGGAR